MHLVKIIWRMFMKVSSKSGAAIAAAAATLFLAGMTISTNAQAADGHCMGANACKGQSAILESHSFGWSFSARALPAGHQRWLN
jgi:hypothetical protein